MVNCLIVRYVCILNGSKSVTLNALAYCINKFVEEYEREYKSYEGYMCKIYSKNPMEMSLRSTNTIFCRVVCEKGQALFCSLT